MRNYWGENYMPFGGYSKCQAGMCASGMLAGGDQTVITHSFNA